MKTKPGLLLAFILMITTACSLPFGLSDLFNKNPDDGTLVPNLQMTTEKVIDPIAAETETPQVLAENSLQNLVSNGAVEVVEISGSATELGFVGEVMNVVVKNLSDDTVEVKIPCGTIFMPDDASIQQMMVIQPVSVVLAAGESATITPFVVCIQSSNGSPSPGDSYTLGSSADGDLLQLADCFCRNDIDPQADFTDLFSVQFATWMVTDQLDLSALSDSSFDAISGDNPELSQLMNNFTSILAPDAQSWLDRCNITIGGD